jgi:dolichol-phosphate mannosyltransferase
MPEGATKTLVFVPTYEERENVQPLLVELRVHAPDADIVFMDDNSPDGTGEVLDELAKTEPRLKVIHRPGKQGIGAAHLAGIAYAYDHGYDLLVTLDCDFTHSPADIPVLVAKTSEVDMVVGSRFLQSGSLPGWSPARKVLTRLGHMLTATVLGVHGDATGAFRVYRLAGIPPQLFDLVTARGYAFFFESLFVAHKNGIRIGEVPIKLPARTQGHSKMSFAEIRRSIEQLFQLLVASKTHPERYRLRPDR